MTPLPADRHRTLSSRRRPPRPTPVLDRLLLRLRREVDAFPMDPDLPARVEQEVLRLQARPRAPTPAPLRTPPPRGPEPRRPRRRWMAAGIFLLALLASVALPGGPRLGPPAAFAGPQEARAAWARAQALRDAPWRERVLAYRATAAAAHPTDRLRIRALAALGGVLREADQPHGAASAEWLAAHLGPRSDDTRLAAHLAHAKAMRAEGDREAARRLLGEVARDARSESPRLADQALDLLAEEAFHDRDLAAVEGALDTALRERAAAVVVLRAAGRAGELRLATGDRPAAQRHLATARRALGGVAGRDDEEALLATKAWLDLPLRTRLAVGESR